MKIISSALVCITLFVGCASPSLHSTGTFGSYSVQIETKRNLVGKTVHTFVVLRPVKAEAPINTTIIGGYDKDGNCEVITVSRPYRVMSPVSDDPLAVKALSLLREARSAVR